mmetsp:Transcript_62463/g.145389  ORF Transcript_62463/g.145389 Transcript_62463/m.145389 type:complete len:208 (+) Transcript_62463:486-1109(+)
MRSTNRLALRSCSSCRAVCCSTSFTSVSTSPTSCIRTPLSRSVYSSASRRLVTARPKLCTSSPTPTCFMRSSTSCTSANRSRSAVRVAPSDGLPTSTNTGVSTRPRVANRTCARRLPGTDRAKLRAPARASRAPPAQTRDGSGDRGSLGQPTAPPRQLDRNPSVSSVTALSGSSPLPLPRNAWLQVASLRNSRPGAPSTPLTSHGVR